MRYLIRVLAVSAIIGVIAAIVVVNMQSTSEKPTLVGMVVPVNLQEGDPKADVLTEIKRQSDGDPFVTFVDETNCADVTASDCLKITVIDRAAFEEEWGQYGPEETEVCYTHSPALYQTWFGGERLVETDVVNGVTVKHFTYGACKVDNGFSSLMYLPNAAPVALHKWVADDYIVIEYNVAPNFAAFVTGYMVASQ